MNEIPPKNTQLFQTIVNSVVIISFSKILAQFIFFIMRYVVLINWLNSVDVANVIIFFRYTELLQLLFLISPYTLPKFIAEDKYSKVFVVSFSFVILCLNFLLIFIGVFCYLYFTPQEILQNIPNNLFLLLIIFTLISLVVQKQIESIFLGLKKNISVFCINILFSFSYGFLCLFLVYLTSFQMVGSLIAYILANMIAIGYGVISLYRKYRAKLHFRLILFVKKFHDINPQSHSIHKNIVQFNIPLFLGGLFYFLNYRINTLFLQHGELTTLIYYDISLSLIIFLIGFIGIPIQDSIFPHITKAIANGSSADITNILKITHQIIGLVFIPIIIVIYLLADVVLSTLYPLYQDEIFQFMFRISLYGAIFYIFNQFYGRIITAKGKTILILVGQAIGSIINLIVFGLYAKFPHNLWLLGAFPISTLVTYVFYYISAKKILNLKITNLNSYQIIIWVFAIFSLFFLAETAQLNNWLLSLISLLIYATLLYLTKFISKDDLSAYFHYAKALLQKRKK